jgi:hypothetical protein
LVNLHNALDTRRLDANLNGNARTLMSVNPRLLQTVVSQTPPEDWRYGSQIHCSYRIAVPVTMGPVDSHQVDAAM